MLDELNDKSLSELREIATAFGIDFQSNIGKVKLIAKIVEDQADVDGSNKPLIVEGVNVTQKKSKNRADVMTHFKILKRIRISPNDPQLKGRNGISHQVGNKFTSAGKFVPFDTAWHVPLPVYDALKRKQWRETKFVTDATTGMKVPVVRMRNALVVEDLDPLTQEELNVLAADQSARGSIPNNE